MLRRPAVTLVEVLVAIFVMGIGLIALLTLFPLGVLSMAVAIKEQRCAECGRNGGALATAQSVRTDGLLVGNPLPPPGYRGADPWGPPGAPLFGNNGYDVNSLLPNVTVPQPFINPLPIPGALQPASRGAPSYPLFVDPIGWYSTSSFAIPINGVPVQSGGWVGGVPGVLSRRRTSYIQNSALGQLTAAANFFTLLDDLVFDTANPGQPESTGTALLRETRYSWAYVVQQPNKDAPNLVNLSVVVFNKRPLALNSSLSLPEYVYAPQNVALNIVSNNPTYYDLQSNTITIDYTNNVPPPLRPGDWILDVTLDQHWVNAVNKKATAVLYPHAYFYRVVNTAELEAVPPGLGALHQYLQCEVQGPLRGFDPVHSVGLAAQGFPATPPAALLQELSLSANTFTGTSIVIEGVAEVYERGTGP